MRVRIGVYLPNYLGTYLDFPLAVLRLDERKVKR